VTDEAVGIVGVGRMGGAIAQRLLAHGRQVVATDRSTDARNRVEAVGAQIVNTPRGVAERCRQILVVVNTDAQVVDAISAEAGVIAGAEPGTIVAIHSTIRLDTLHSVAAAARAHGVVVIDAGVTGGADPALRGELAVLVGGEESTLEQLRPVFSSYASVIVRLGGLGTGMAAKHAVQTVLMGKVAAAYEGLLLAHAAGVDTIALAQAVQHAEDQSGIHPFFLAARARAFAGQGDDAWRAITTHQRPVAEKDLHAALALADELGLALPATRGASDDMPAAWSS
jgi:3-hydroxyisobutyrate dehydrogenase-like beta-hydroxyacid dehydrogenase